MTAKQGSGRKWLIGINIVAKAALLGLVFHAIFFNELTQYRAKAFGIRIVAYPIVASVAFIWYMVARRKNKKMSYPIGIDLCLTFVVLADFAGNTLNLYDSIWWWDDAMHFLISMPWVLAAAPLLKKYATSAFGVFLLVAGYGAMTHALWEIFEYFSFVRSNSMEFSTAYEDTIFDLILSLGGSIIAAGLYAYTHRKKRS